MLSSSFSTFTVSSEALKMLLDVSTKESVVPVHPSTLIYVYQYTVSAKGQLNRHHNAVALQLFWEE